MRIKGFLIAYVCVFFIGPILVNATLWDPHSIPRHPCENKDGKIVIEYDKLGRCSASGHNDYVTKFYTDADLNYHVDFAGSVLNNFNKFPYSNKYYVFSKWNAVNASYVELSYSDFSFSDMRGFFAEKAFFKMSKFVATNLKGCSLAYSKLSKADLRGANLSYCDLLFTDFSGSDISGVNFLEANLIGAQFKNVKYDESTKFPKGFNRNRLK